MNKNMITLFAVGSVLVLLVLVYFFMGISYRNQEVVLRANFNNTLQANKVDYDAMWKIINQTSQVPRQYSEDFTNAYTKILSANEGEIKDGNMVKNLFAVATGMRVPELDPSMYRKVQSVIESERIKFANAQKMLIAIKNEHDILRTRFPGNLFVGGVEELKLTLVTSTKTTQAFETGVDDDTEVFKK